MEIKGDGKFNATERAIAWGTVREERRLIHFEYIRRTGFPPLNWVRSRVCPPVNARRRTAHTSHAILWCSADALSTFHRTVTVTRVPEIDSVPLPTDTRSITGASARGRGRGRVHRGRYWEAWSTSRLAIPRKSSQCGSPRSVHLKTRARQR